MVLLGFLFLQNRFQFLAPATQTLFIPTPDCGTPTLLLGSSTFQIETIQPTADGSLAVPSDTSGIAYWVEGTNTNYVFVLSPTPENLSIMSTITVGSTAKATWQNCISTMYNLSGPQQGSLNDSILLDQSADGITLFFQTDSSGNGFVFKGMLADENFSVMDTPRPDESGILAEISLLETTTSPDGMNIRIGISILNYGQTAFTILPSDISFTPQNSTPLVMTGSEPSLPKEIAPNATETIYFTFPRPSSPTATLKIFTVEYDIEGY